MNNIVTRFILGVALFLTAELLCCCNSQSKDEIHVVKNVDLKRYMGEWHEIARFDNSFEKNIVKAKAVYSLNDDYTVSVVNSGVDDKGEQHSAIGNAYSTNSDNSKLRVSFFWPFYGDYYILELDNNYEWALIGGRDNGYLWILSRNESIPENTLKEILFLAQKRGYDTSKLIYNRPFSADR